MVLNFESSILKRYDYQNEKWHADLCYPRAIIGTFNKTAIYLTFIY